MNDKIYSKFHFFGEPLGLLLGAPHERIEYTQTVSLSVAGAESNVAIGLARLGHRCIFNSALGIDPFGGRIIRALRAENIDVDNVVTVPDTVTGLITRNCFPWREPDVFYHRRYSAFSTNGEEVAQRIKFAPGDVFFTTGITMALGESPLKAVVRLIARARQAGAIICIDVNYRKKLWDQTAFRKAFLSLFSQIDVLFLGREEGEILTRLTTPSAMAKWILRHGVGEVIVKDGHKGAWHFAPDEIGIHRKAFSLRTVVDPIGAGDAFNAGFLHGRAEGRTRSECLRLGNALGALVCLTPGDWESLPSPRELQSFMKGDFNATR